MISFLLALADSSSVQIEKSEYTYYFRKTNYLNSKGNVLPTTFIDKGIQCAVNVNGDTHYTTNTEDFAVSGLYLSYETYATDDSGNFIIKIENINQEDVTFKFGCTIDPAWLDTDIYSPFGESNNYIYPIKDSSAKPKSFYVTNPTDSHKDNKMTINLRDSINYIPPDHSWYGVVNLPDNEYPNRIWYKFDGEPQPFVQKGDIEACWHWNSRTLSPGEVVKYGFSINFLYEHTLRVSTPLERKSITALADQPLDFIIQSEALMSTNTYVLKRSIDNGPYETIKTITNPPYYIDRETQSFPAQPLSKKNLKYQLFQSGSSNDSMIFNFDIVYTMHPSIIWQQPNKYIFYSSDVIKFTDLLVKTDSDVKVTKLLVNSKGEAVIRETTPLTAPVKNVKNYIDMPDYTIDTSKLKSDHYKLFIRCISEYGMTDETPLEFEFDVRQPKLVYISWVRRHCAPPYPILVNLTLYETVNVYFTTQTTTLT
ncbi:hypothetical protein TVAG_001030 [Trichomonas vaginalis G3]|uniref:Uncharacterized protein n=1 Tax=Trichomonas vaginalis (strain ATCC PRA-98 / G3) TaxID=412133 RepID=A2GJ99_TRIV3|nr:hypothetical protein TVAG_001030 [Trichomonas vaginalis G3]|eukprot:XP_001295696.1 hypothetical protein [Trichomonas vaginalis G3]